MRIQHLNCYPNPLLWARGEVSFRQHGALAFQGAGPSSAVHRQSQARVEQQ